jgi:hypothetical protein
MAQSRNAEGESCLSRDEFLGIFRLRIVVAEERVVARVVHGGQVSGMIFETKEVGANGMSRLCNADQHGEAVGTAGKRRMHVAP